MPEVRCPMCSKLNEAEIDICVFCGARLKPLVLDPASEDTHTEAPQEASGEAGADGEARKKGTDWLGRLRSAVGFSEESDAPEAEEADELPDWLDRLRPPASIGTLDEGEEIVHPFEESGDTDWLTRLRKVDDPTEATAEEKDLIEEQADFADEPALAPAVIPEWLQVTRVEEEEDADDEDEDDLADEEVDAAEAVELGERLAMHAPEPSVRDDTFEDEEQSFDDEAIGEPEEIEAGSDPAEEECEAEEPPAPYVPALILGDEAPEDEPEDVDLESITVPEWVGDEQMPEAYAADRDAGDRPEITKAVLPEWLEAMRPIETFRTQEEEEEGEQPQPVETIGPLAGLSDVLMAEPVVAMPRIPGVVAASVSVTQQESEQVHVLRKLVEAERQDFAPARPRQRAAPILHWIVGLLLVAATILPQLITDAIFPAPRWVPQDLETLRNLVEELPRDRPALLVADYDPGYAAELEAGAALCIQP